MARTLRQLRGQARRERPAQRCLRGRLRGWRKAPPALCAALRCREGGRGRAHVARQPWPGPAYGGAGRCHVLPEPPKAPCCGAARARPSRDGAGGCLEPGKDPPRARGAAVQGRKGVQGSVRTGGALGGGGVCDAGGGGQWRAGRCNAMAGEEGARSAGPGRGAGRKPGSAGGAPGAGDGSRAMARGCAVGSSWGQLQNLEGAGWRGGHMQQRRSRRFFVRDLGAAAGRRRSVICIGAGGGAVGGLPSRCCVCGVYAGARRAIRVSWPMSC